MSGFDDHPEAPASVSTTLSTLVDQYGPVLFNDPPRLRLLLVQSHPDATTTIDAVLAALEAGVPQRLMATHDDASIAALLPRLADQVAQRDGVPYKAAVQAVRAWALALALPDDGLDDRMPIVERPVKATVDFAAIVTPLATRAPVEAIAPRVDESSKSDAFADTVITTQFMPAPPDESPSIAPTEFVPLPLSPLPRTRATEFSAPSPKEHVTGHALQYPADPKPSRTRGRVIAALALVALVLVAGIAWRAWQETPTAEPVASNVATPKADVPSERPVLQPTAEPPTTPPVTIADADPAVATPSADPSSPVATSAPVTTNRSVADPSPAPSASNIQPALAIARIEVPRVVADQAFTVRLVVTGPIDQVVAVEERSVDRASGRVASRTVPTRTLKPTAGGVIAVPVRALAGGDRSSMDFLLVDQGGSRSAPKRIAFDVASRSDDSRGETRTAALGSGASTGADAATACTPSTCGVVVESRAIDGGASLYRIVVMNDARESSSFSVPYRLQAGTRVRLTGGRVLPVASSP